MKCIHGIGIRKPCSKCLIESSLPKPPEYCAANRDGDCYHEGCPQKKHYQSQCPIPEREREA